MSSIAPRTGLVGEFLSTARERGYNLGQYLAIGFQLGLFLIVVYQFDLESRAFLHLGILTFFGWAIHYLLPIRLRLPFFVLLSLVGIELVFGFQEERWSAEGLLQGAWIITLVLGLIALCHLPVRFGARIALLLLAAGVLALGRAELLPVPWSSAIWPIVASMVMFRLIVYVYHLRHEKQPVGALNTLAYFFMLPNVCFPLFPVVDFKVFRRTYYDQADRHKIYQIGIVWLFRGALHLIAYRFIYQNFVIDVTEVSDSRDALQYLLWPILLYLRVSGTFHIITGLLHLFGFNLPPTHHLYFLASSFTDFWRRINIYWKDFIMNVFYYPVYFKIRRFGDTFALVIATFLAFFVTWVLHSYQVFWIRGDWLLAWNDGLFWAILGALVVVNSLYESKRGRRRRLQGKALSWRATTGRALRTVGVFACITALWSFWSADSIAEWLSVWRVFGNSALDPGVVFALLAVAALVGGSAALLARGHLDSDESGTQDFGWSAARVTATGALLIALSLPGVQRPLGPTISPVLAGLQRSQLNQRDFAAFERGYYENLFDVGQFSPELWEIYRTRPEEWQALRVSDLVEQTSELPFFVLRPSFEGRHAGALIQTNSWRMRDVEYDKLPPPNTIRVALLGASFVFGNGVENDETFESLLEERLNVETVDDNSLRYELLNFAVGAYSPLQRLVQLEDTVIGFEPDYIVYVEHAKAAGTIRYNVNEALRTGADLRYGFIADVVSRAGIEPSELDESTNSAVLTQQLAPYDEELLGLVYRRIAEVGRQNGTPVIWVYLPRPEPDEQPGLPEPEARLAREAGFTIIDLSDVYDGQDLSSLWIERWDHHPNAVGHRLIADRLYEELRRVASNAKFNLLVPMADPAVDAVD